MGIAHIEVYWPHQMELQVSLILFIKNLESLLHFIIESNTPSLLWFCLQYTRQQEVDHRLLSLFIFFSLYMALKSKMCCLHNLLDECMFYCNLQYNQLVKKIVSTLLDVAMWKLCVLDWTAYPDDEISSCYFHIKNWWEVSSSYS
jgi:hypothetical protein